MLKTLGLCLYVNKQDWYTLYESLSPVFAQLTLDDIGYVYNPFSPDTVYIVPGGLEGNVGNMRLPYHLHYGNAFKKTTAVLGSLDQDYSKLLIAITDSVGQNDLYDINSALEDDLRDDWQITFLVYAIGQNWHPEFEDIWNKHPRVIFCKIGSVMELKNLLQGVKI